MFFSKKRTTLPLILSPIFSKTAMDMISLEQITVMEHLRAGPRNFVIRQGDFYHFVNTKDILSHLEDSTVFMCKKIGGTNPSNVEIRVELFNTRKISTIHGYITLNSLRDAMVNVLDKNIRIFDLSPSIKRVSAVTSKLYYQGRTDMVSSLHCQEGSEGEVHTLEPVLVDGIPTFDVLDYEYMETDVKLIVLAHTLAKYATVKSKILKSTRDDIIVVGKRILLEDRGRKFKQDVRSGNISIDNSEQLKLLNTLSPMFRPNLTKISIEKDVFVDDFSFIKNIVKIRHFDCKNMDTNVSALVHELINHSASLESLTMISNRIIHDNVSFSKFNRLENVRIINEGHNTLAFESALKRASEIPYLRSLFVDGDESPSPNLFIIISKFSATLREIDINSKGFEGELSPMYGGFEGVRVLNLNLPKFTGSFKDLARMRNLNVLTTVTSADFDLGNNFVPSMTNVRLNLENPNPVIGRFNPELI